MCRLVSLIAETQAAAAEREGQGQGSQVLVVDGAST